MSPGVGCDSTAQGNKVRGFIYRVRSVLVHFKYTYLDDYVLFWEEGSQKEYSV